MSDKLLSVVGNIDYVTANAVRCVLVTPYENRRGLCDKNETRYQFGAC